jgi:hypothetical protein
VDGRQVRGAGFELWRFTLGHRPERAIGRHDVIVVVMTGGRPRAGEGGADIRTPDILEAFHVFLLPASTYGEPFDLR